MRTHHKFSSFWLGVLLSCLCSGCSSVTVLRLTSETFPSRSVGEVAILSEAPPQEHIRIANLSETSSSRADTLQKHILKKAAQLGADAVVFSAPHSRSEQRVDYQPMYSPWGYYAPYYYGPGALGYSSMRGSFYGAWGPSWGYAPYGAVPYTVRVTTLKGVAIRYTGTLREPVQ